MEAKYKGTDEIILFYSLIPWHNAHPTIVINSVGCEGHNIIIAVLAHHFLHCFHVN